MQKFLQSSNSHFNVHIFRENEKNAIISSLFEEIRLEATLFGGSNSSLDVKQEVSDDGDQPTELSETAPSSGVNKKLKKR